MDHRIALRPAVPDDALAVAGVHVRSWQVGYRGLLPDDELDSLRPEDRAARYRFDGASGEPATTVATDGERIAGFVTVVAGSDGRARAVGRVMALYVDPGSWGAGIGGALIATARRQLLDAGCTDAELWVLDGNERAERFYRSDGWAPDGRVRREAVWGVEALDRCFTRTLAAG